MNNITECVASNSMELSGRNTCLSFVKAVWRDKVILVMFNNITNTVDDILLDPTLQKDDVAAIENMVRLFLT